MNNRPNSTRPTLLYALALLAFASLAATTLGAFMVWGASFNTLVPLAAMIGSAAILGAANWLRNAIREWRWNSGHRLN